MKTFNRYQEILLSEVKKTSFKMKAESKGSFRELLFPTTSMQSICIKMGNVLENAFNIFVKENAENLKESEASIRGHQLDLYFKYEDTIYYFEVKSNINLDSEKGPATIDKVNDIKSYLKDKYGENVVAKVLVSRHATAKNLTNVNRAIFNKDSVIGYAEFFKIFGVEVSKNEWEDFFKKVGVIIIETSV
jgi:competence protein ComGF